MIKNLAGGSVISYGPTLPDAASAFDGTLFYKTTGTDQGLFLFSFNQDASSVLIGDQVQQTWSQIFTPSLFVMKSGDTMSGTLVLPSIRLLSASAQSGGNIYANSGLAQGITISADGGPILFQAGGNLRMQLQINGNLQLTTAAGTGNVWTNLNDGSGSGLDADLLDGLDSTYFQNASNINSGTLDAARLPFMPVQQGGGTGQLSNKVYIGWTNSGQLAVQVDSTNFGTTWPINVAGSSATANYANSAGTAGSTTNAQSAQYLRQNGAANGQNMTFNWNGQAGQPNWVWGGNDGVNMYVYNPSNFSVASAVNSTNAVNASNSASVNHSFNRTDGTAYPVLWGTPTSTSQLYSAASVTIQSSTGILSATQFNGSGAGLTGTASSLTAGAANSVAWTNVSGRPTALSAFTNDVGYIVTTAAYTWTGQQQFNGAGVAIGATQQSGQIFATRSDVAGSASISFLRQSNYGVNFGMDSDNVVRLGGWSDGANTYRMQIDTAGNATFRNNVTAYSDRKLKKDIEKISEPLEKVSKLEGVTYTRIDSGERQTGLIAQDVLAVLPEAVVEMKDGTLTLAYGNLAGLLVESIKELKEQVTSLKAEVAALRG